jgi:hypothetical protein
MSNNTTGNAGTLVPITGPGGRLPIGPSFRNSGGNAGPGLLGAGILSPPQAVGMTPVPLSAAIDSQARGVDPRPRHAAPMQPAGTFPG